MDVLGIDDLPTDILGVIVGFVNDCMTAVLGHVSKRFAAIIRGCCINPDAVCAQAADDNYFEVLKWTFAMRYPMFINMGRVVAHGNIEMLEWIHDNDVEWDRLSVCEMYRSAAAADRLDVIKWIHSHGYVENIYIAFNAAKHGQQHVLEWLSEFVKFNEYVFMNAAQGCHFEIMKWLYNRGCPYDGTAVEWVAYHGDLDAIKWLHNIGCPMETAYYYAACEGKLEILKWLRDNGYNVPVGCDLSQRAAFGGQIHVLEWLLEINYPISRRGYYDAVQGGNIDVFKWLLEKNVVMGGEYMCCAAARAGHLDMLKWLRAEGYPWDKSVCTSTMIGSHVGVLKWAIENGCPYDFEDCIEEISHVCYRGKSAPPGELEILQYLHSIGCRFDRPVLCSRAAAAGDLALLKWLREHGCPWDTLTCKYANRSDPWLIRWIHTNGCPCRHTMSRREYSKFRKLSNIVARGDLEMLKWTYVRQRNWDYSTIGLLCRVAVKYSRLHIIQWLHFTRPSSAVMYITASRAAVCGNQDVLEWLFNTGHPIDSDVVRAAVRGGHFGLLKWLYEQSPKPCIWNEYVPATAAIANNIAIIKWLFEKGCPFDSNTTYFALSRGHLRLSQWLYEHGVEMNAIGIRKAKKAGHTNILDWLVAIGYIKDMEAI